MREISNLLNNKCGVYIITNLVNGKKYIGSSKNLKDRLQRHIWELNKGIHINTHLQNSWNKYGEDSFQYSVLEYCSEEVQFSRENFFIETILPEYNIEIGAMEIKHSKETKEKISNTLKNKYSQGVYPQQKYAGIYYIYDIRDWSLYKKVQGLNQAAKLFYSETGALKISQVNKGIIKDFYVICDRELSSIEERKNFIYENAFRYKSSTQKEYLGVYINHTLQYFRTTKQAVQFMNCSSESTLKKHRTATICNPYIVPNTNYYVFWTNQFIPINDKAVLQGNLQDYYRAISEETQIQGNAEIIEEIKDSSTSYSVGNEPLL